MYPHWVAESLWDIRACWCRVRREDWQGFRKSLEWKELEVKSWLWWKHSVFSLQFIFKGQWFQGALILGRNKWNFVPKLWAPKLIFHPQRLFQSHCHLDRQWHSGTVCAKLLQTCFPGSASCWDHCKIHGSYWGLSAGFQVFTFDQECPQWCWTCLCEALLEELAPGN